LSLRRGHRVRPERPSSRKTLQLDGLTLLSADHNRVRGYFARFTAADDANDTRRWRYS
jgi:hypothetical protein